MWDGSLNRRVNHENCDNTGQHLGTKSYRTLYKNLANLLEIFESILRVFVEF